uniref:Uncharacterized protein n=1 Tax=Rhizophora mucronata TaxID=61149 RepID=A0A2P2R4Q9_RHIMU
MPPEDKMYSLRKKI